MKRLKVIHIDEYSLKFNNGVTLYSNHVSDCCERHYLSFADLTLDDFEGLEFDLTNPNFFKKIKDYGIELVPIRGYSVRIPGYGYNNGYYSSDLELIITDGKKFRKTFDITECQDISD